MSKKLRKTTFFFKKYTSVSKSANPKAPWKMVVKIFFLCQNILHKLCSGVGGFVGPSLSSKKNFATFSLKFWNFGQKKDKVATFCCFCCFLPINSSPSSFLVLQTPLRHYKVYEVCFDTKKNFLRPFSTEP